VSLSSSFRFGAWLDRRQPPLLSWGAATRLLDLVVVTTALILLAPLMVLIAAAIRIEDGRPILFSQTRLGRGGRQFSMHKFRKFHEPCRGPGRSAGCALTMENDPRLTCIGRILARTKLDELPQLWNVLKGDMSLVGPRPESLDFADCFDGAYRGVLKHKPGIFGPSQVLFRNEAVFYRGRPDPEQFYRAVLFPLKADIDSAYFSHRTLWRDLVWIVRGALAVFGCSSALREAEMLVQDREDRNRQRRRTEACGVLPAHAGSRRYAADPAPVARQSGTMRLTRADAE
jgi:lipopolysaccharide/colanic/teichoic acid biosynthesis glycosyltransferase